MKQLLKLMLLVCVCMFALTGQALSDSLSNAMRAFDEGNYTKALKLFRPLSKKGNAVAQFKLATMYYSGKGVRLNHKAALKYYRLSAQHGHVAAQSNLATMYYRGEGVPRNYVLAHMWKNIAATRAKEDRQLRYFEQLKTLEKDMTAKQLAEAQGFAKKCTRQKFKRCKQ